MDTSRHAAHFIVAGEWLATLQSGTVTLIYADRCRRRVRLMDDAGAPFLLDLVRPARLADGDGLVLADGTIIRVIAKPEPLVEAVATDARHLARLAWHVGNRHVAARSSTNVPAHRARCRAGADAARPRRADPHGHRAVPSRGRRLCLAGGGASSWTRLTAR